ncbi:Morphogenesis-related protein [Lachnellula occidentalis]|uniref:Morphogenesis-related protein n=1 Tax=Lachnellula occidentalis TaxID=215460 RepID=A0A8H8RQT4_9HELO|nr:Morphogenesis-related protein [Lachnellula occidentalis]
MARDSFATFIPLSVDTDARTKIIFDFFDLLSAIAAHAKTNGLGGRKLSRLAGWWAFEHSDGGNGFEGGYKGWTAAADAASHLFFAYLRSLSPESIKGLNGISTLPMSLQKLVQETEYPPQRPSLLQSSTTRVVMIVDSVSPTPFALLRRANHFQYRDDDRALQEFADFEDPVKALTDECRRVLKSISTANQSQVSNSKDSTGLRDASWSRFEDIGFSAGFDELEEDEDSNFTKRRQTQGLRTAPHSRNMAGGRPTTPSWADFLSAGFVDEAQNGPAPLLLPPDKILPPIDTRGKSSQSHRPTAQSQLEPGELASITRFDLDDSFWWVWITSLAGEETPDRKAAFGRCALIETVIRSGRWLVMEEMVKGAAPEPELGAYIAEKKSFWGRSKKNKVARRKSTTGKQDSEPNSSLRPTYKTSQSQATSKTSIGPDQHARIQAAAIQLQQKQRQLDEDQQIGTRRGRDMDMMSQKTSSVFTLQPVIRSAASPAMQWANQYDKAAIREAYLANANHGRGLGDVTMQTNGHNTNSQDTLQPQPEVSPERDLPAVPEAGPPVPSKTPTPPPAPSPAPFPPTPASDQHLELSEKAAEIALPAESHPAMESSPSRLPQPSMEVSRPSDDKQQSGSSPEFKKQHNKLKKKEAGGGGGFRKMFGRSKIRPAKVQESAPPQVTNGQNSLQPGGGGLGRKLSNMGRKKSSSPAPAAPASTRESVAQSIAADDTTPVATPHQEYEQSYAPSVEETLSRVDTADAHEAHQAFSSFDQGPLEDIPAFVEGSPRESVDAVSPIYQARESEDDGAPLEKEQSQTQDRWAQIRKNAADRAAQRQSEEQSRGGYSQKTDGDDGETSGEESKSWKFSQRRVEELELTNAISDRISSRENQSPRR